jgi:hypothetical protein
MGETKFKIYLLLFIGVLTSCRTKTDITPRLSGQEYYNNKTGSWIIYKVDSIVFSDFNQIIQKVDTFHYLVKETITEKFLNASGNETNRIERYKRMMDTLPWEITNVWTSNISTNSLEKVEENIRYVKMSFPVTSGKIWPGNQFNTLVPWDYTYRDIKVPMTICGFVFNNTVTVLQKDSADDNFIEKRFAKEIYAEGIGMVYKQMDTLEIQNSIKKGLYFRQTIIDWIK